MVLSFKNYSLSLKETGKAILKDITIDFLPGEIYCIFGHSGSGKTTMLNAMLKNLGKSHEFIQKGEITLNDTDIQAIDTDKYFSEISAVLQNPEDQFLFPKTIYEYSFPILNKGFSELSAKLSFSEFKEKLNLTNEDVYTLSAGEKQALEIYSNLAAQKQFYIYDEPLANLDRKKVLEFFTEVNKLKKAGKTVIIFEHRTCLLRYLTQNNFTLKKGKLSSFDFSCLTKIKPLSLKEASADVVLSLENLSVELTGSFNYLLKSLTLKKGELKLITGDNGIGKTTIFNILLGNLRPTKTSKVQIKFKNRVYRNLRRLKKYVSYLPHDVRYMFSETQTELELRKVKNQELAHQLLANFNLTNKLTQHPFSLSHGEQQRLGLILALAKEPEFLLLDEPTSGLDDELCFTICSTIGKYINTHECSALIITHDPRVKAYFKVEEITVKK